MRRSWRLNQRMCTWSRLTSLPGRTAGPARACRMWSAWRRWCWRRAGRGRGAGGCWRPRSCCRGCWTSRRCCLCSPTVLQLHPLPLPPSLLPPPPPPLPPPPLPLPPSPLRQCVLSQASLDGLLNLFLTTVQDTTPTCATPPDELLYGSASLLQAGAVLCRDHVSQQQDHTLLQLSGRDFPS